MKEKTLQNTYWPFELDKIHDYAFWNNAFTPRECEQIIEIGSKKKNIVHFLFNNYSHESVGGHDTSTKQVNFGKLAQVLGYKFSVRASNFQDLEKNLTILKKKRVSSFIEIICGKGHRQDVSRPKESLLLLKNRFKFKI